MKYFFVLITSLLISCVQTPAHLTATYQQTPYDPTIQDPNASMIVFSNNGRLYAGLSKFNGIESRGDLRALARAIEFLPGEHELEIAYMRRKGDLYYYTLGRRVVTHIFEAGKRYRIRGEGLEDLEKMYLYEETSNETIILKEF